MKASQQLMRIIREEIEAIDFGVVKITVNKDGPYTEISTERKTRIAKTSDEPPYHQG